MSTEFGPKVVPTDRALLGEHGELTIAGLTLDDIKDKRILDVGIGGGEALLEAVQLGLDYHGIEILPLINPSEIGLSQRAVQETQEKKDKLMRIAQQYPNMFTTADAASQIPFPNDAFQVTFSSLGLPEYARNPKEALTSILEMCRVTRGLVAFPVSWDPNRNFPHSRGVADFGSPSYYFQFKLDELFKELAVCGITNQRFQHKNRRGIHLDTEEKDNEKLEVITRLLIPKADIFLAQ